MRACDIDDGREDVQEIGVGAANDPDAGLAVAPSERPLTRFDACGECRAAIESGGVKVLVERYVDGHKTRRRRSPATGKPTATA